MVIVVSGSMEPEFYRGDVMVLSGWNIEELNASSIVLDESIAGKDISKYAKTYCSVDGQTELFSCREIAKDLMLGKLQREQVKATTIVFKNNQQIDISTQGDVVVYWSEAAGIPVIHRVVTKIHADDGLFLLTKGDSKFNPFIDQDTALSPSAVPMTALQGKAILKVPLIGYIKLILVDDLPCFLSSPITGRACQFP